MTWADDLSGPKTQLTARQVHQVSDAAGTWLLRKSELLPQIEPNEWYAKGGTWATTSTHIIKGVGLVSEGWRGHNEVRELFWSSLKKSWNYVDAIYTLFIHIVQHTFTAYHSLETLICLSHSLGEFHSITRLLDITDILTWILLPLRKSIIQLKFSRYLFSPHLRAVNPTKSVYH